MTLFSPEQRKRLLDAAEEADRLSEWPTTGWNTIRNAGVPARSIPIQFGGTGLGPVELLQGMEEIAACCLTTAFILSQREAAIRHLLRGPEHLKERYLPQSAAGDSYVTVGLSQLTTSRQHLGPALRATHQTSGCYQLDGEIPWVTGADQAAAIIAGAMLQDGTQILFVIPAEKLVGCIEPPLPLAAVCGSRTSLILCRGLIVEPDLILAGPAESVLGKLGGGGLDTSCLAIGLATAATDLIRQEANQRPDLRSIAERCEESIQTNRTRLHSLALTNAEPCDTLDLRTSCTKLALRTTQAALMITKGNGFVAPHPAQRWARQAMFFLVWSCPRPVAEGMLADLADW
jgi:alkylation response protein AidB-like acyl-CoA dehydrogenase